MVARIDDKGEGHLERFRYLERIDRERERHPDYADYGRYLEPGSRDISVEPTDHLHAIAGEPDFLLGLAKCRVDRVRITLLDPPARKGDLPGMALRCGVRWVRRTDIPSARSISGTRTAAGRNAALGAVIPGFKS